MSEFIYLRYMKIHFDKINHLVFKFLEIIKKSLLPIKEING